MRLETKYISFYCQTQLKPNLSVQDSALIVYGTQEDGKGKKLL